MTEIRVLCTVLRKSLLGTRVSYEYGTVLYSYYGTVLYSYDCTTVPYSYYGESTVVRVPYYGESTGVRVRQHDACMRMQQAARALPYGIYVVQSNCRPPKLNLSCRARARAGQLRRLTADRSALVVVTTFTH